MVSTEKILQETGIRAAKTLTRWHQRGLIPPPEVGLHPSGRGKMAYYPDWVVERCVRIRQLVRGGYSLDQVAEMLGSNWSEEERRAKATRYRLKEASARLDHVACVRNFAVLVGDKIMPMLEKLGSRSVRTLRRFDDVLMRERTVEQALGLVHEGYNSVLVFDGTSWSIVPDFVVGQALAQVGSSACPCVALPIFAEVVTAFAPIEQDLPSAPTIKPVPRVAKTEADRTGEFIVHPVGLWDFELSSVGTTPAERQDNETSSACEKEV